MHQQPASHDSQARAQRASQHLAAASAELSRMANGGVRYDAADGFTLTPAELRSTTCHALFAPLPTRYRMVMLQSLKPASQRVRKSAAWHAMPERCSFRSKF